MTHRQLTALLCRFLGLYCIVQSIATVGMAIQWILLAKASSGAMLGGSLSLLNFTSVVPPILQGAFGVVLLIFADGIAALMIAEDERISVTTTISHRELGAILFSVIGLLLVTQSVPRLVELAAATFIGTNASGSSNLGIPRRFASGYGIAESQVAAAMVQLLFGLGLLYRYRLPSSRDACGETRSVEAVQTEHP